MCLIYVNKTIITITML